MIDAEVAIIGGGPAGAATALRLLPARRVVLIERRETQPERIGESLPAAARHLLRDLGVWEEFLGQGHAPCYANRSRWGGPEPVEQDALRDPDGHGWHLDRARFEEGLRGTAVARGAILLRPAQPRAVRRRDDGWEIDFDGETVRARVLIDAGGRASSAPILFGAGRVARDKLVCGWVRGTDEAEHLTYIESEPDGWWYSAPLPQGKRVLAFHTDADLPAAGDAQSPGRLLARASRLAGLSAVLEGARFGEVFGFCAAHSAELDPVAGEGWLAVGDAALAFDPLSSQGLFNALYGGVFGGDSALAMLNGDDAAAARYRAGLDLVRSVYRAHLAAYYGAERRWPDHEFWRLRIG